MYGTAVRAAAEACRVPPKSTFAAYEVPDLRRSVCRS